MSYKTANASMAQFVQNVTVIPDDGEKDEDDNWIEENPVVTSILIVAVLVALAYAVYFWIRSRRKSRKRLAEDSNGSSDSQITPDAFIAQTDRPNEPFVIFKNGQNTVRQERPKKQVLAVPPLFTVSQRKSAPSALDVDQRQQQIPVGWARWSTAGVKKPETNPHDCGAEGSATSSEQTLALPSPSGFVMSVPTRYRRVLDGEGNAVYVPEPAPSYLSVMATSSGWDQSKNAHPIRKS